uniref:Uncharacterized protein n=2 Tax=Guillardia theta TaxID=55529 RepID=A0A7S4PFF6_GUITH
MPSLLILSPRLGHVLMTRSSASGVAALCVAALGLIMAVLLMRTVTSRTGATEKSVMLKQVRPQFHPEDKASYRNLRAPRGVKTESLKRLEKTLDHIVYAKKSPAMYSMLARHLVQHLRHGQSLSEGENHPHYGYPFGYDQTSGWHQEIESYDPSQDGCDCSIDEGERYLECSCGSAWGALTLMDRGCYGCCNYYCCNTCQCYTSGSNGMGATTCHCPLLNSWEYDHSSCTSWWTHNAGPLDPGGYGGITEFEDQPGNLVA